MEKREAAIFTASVGNCLVWDSCARRTAVIQNETKQSESGQITDLLSRNLIKFTCKQNQGITLGFQKAQSTTPSSGSRKNVHFTNPSLSQSHYHPCVHGYTHPSPLSRVPKAPAILRGASSVPLFLPRAPTRSHSSSTHTHS